MKKWVLQNSLIEKYCTKKFFCAVYDHWLILQHPGERKDKGLKKGLSKSRLKSRIDQYFSDEESVKSLAGLALFLDTDTKTLTGLLSENSGRSEMVSRAKTRIEKDIIENGLRGKYNATMSSFLLKTAFGYSEKAEQIQSGDVKIEVSEELKKFAV